MLRLESIAKLLADRWDHLFRQREDADPYRVTVVVTPSAYFDRLRAPFELRYAIDHLPNGFDLVRSLLSEGKGIAILRAPRSPRDIREAAIRLSKTQSSIVDPWLARLIFHEDLPVIDSVALEQARKSGADPYMDARRILNQRAGMIRFALVDLSGKGLLASDTDRINQLNRVIEPLSASYLYHRLNEDWPKKTIRTISVVLRVIALVLILRWTLSLSIVLSFIIAALADDIARQVGALFTLRYSGYTPRQLKKEALPYLVPFIFGVGFAWYASQLYVATFDALAGFVFGLAVISFPVFEMLRRFASIRKTYRDLERAGKLFEDTRKSPTAYVLYELKRNQFEWGLMMGAVIAPLFCALIFYFMSGIALNRWVLAICPVIDVLFAIVWRQAMIQSDRVRFVSAMLMRLG